MKKLMKKIFTLFFFLTHSALQSSAQSYSGPESVEYDAANGRYLVACNGAINSIQQVVSGQPPTLFTSNVAGPNGIEILGSKLWVCDGGRIKSFDLATAALIDNLNLAASFLNGLTSDGVEFLFASDFSAKKIYRINTNTGAFNVMVANTVTSPNGMWYDGVNNRLLFVNWGGSAPVKEISLADSTVATVVTTSQGNCDGIGRDAAGNYYISSWSPQAVYRYDSTFNSPVAVITSGLSNPADIYYNASNDTLAVPNAGNNTVTFHFLGASVSIDEIKENTGVNVFPNPINESAVLEYSLTDAGEVKLMLYNATGKLVKILIDKHQKPGKHSIQFNRTGFAAGQYFFSLQADSKTYKGIITLLEETE
jgi:hypothetical protein